MTETMLDPFDRDHGPVRRTSPWVIAALIGLILMAMAFNVARAGGVSVARLLRGAPAPGVIGARTARNP